jgi:hypothetical protein
MSEACTRKYLHRSVPYRAWPINYSPDLGALFYVGRNLPGYPDHPWITSRRQTFLDEA